MKTSNPTDRDTGTHDGPLVYPADKARGADIILKSRAQRIIFIGGAALGLFLVLLLIALS